MTKTRQRSNSTSRRDKSAKLKAAPATKFTANGIRIDRSQTPLEMLFNDLLGQQTKKETTEDRRKRQASLTGTTSHTVIKGPVRAALYIRVSGERSVRSDLSMPDQEGHLRKYCEQQNWLIVAVYYEPGRSAKSTARKEFKRMIRDASGEGDPPFDKILIHNTARFARSSRDYSLFESLLRHRNIDILAVSQSFSKDAGGMVALRMTNLMDEFYSVRSSVDSTRARLYMIEKGYWPGGTPPYGYKRIACPENPQRSVLDVDNEERMMVEKTYSMAVFGDGNGPPMGVKSIVVWLNEHGYRTRSGSRWSVQAIHRILTHSVYYGEYFWGINVSIRRRPRGL